MNAFGHIILVGWAPIALLLMATQRQRHRGVLLAYFVAWLFLPLAGYSIKGFPDYTKFIATSLGVMLGIVLYDPNRLLKFQARWFDLPMVVWCLGGFVSSITNDLGTYDGLSTVLNNMLWWGLPYLIGRLYFSERFAQRDLLIALIIAACVYVPLCLFEMRMYPVIHRWLYGVSGRVSGEYYGWGPFMWRPTVFMNSAFEVTMLMAVATLAAFSVWRARLTARLFSVPVGLIFAGLFVFTILCKVMSGITLMFIGLVLFGMIRFLPMRLWLIVFALVPPGYMVVRSTGKWSADVLVSAAGVVSDRRAYSLQFRLDNENRLADRAWERPLFGWGRWGRNRVRDEHGRDISETDGLWIVAFGQNGLVGLIALTMVFILPIFLFVARAPPHVWLTHAYIGPLTLAVILGLHMIDNLPNGFTGPIYLAIAGGMMGYIPANQSQKVRVRRKNIVARRAAPRIQRGIHHGTYQSYSS